MKKLLFSLILSLLPIASGAIQYEYFNPLMPQNGALKVNQTIGQLTPPQGKGFGVLSALTNLQSVASSIATNEYGIQVDTLGLVCPTEEAVVAAISAHNTNQSAHSYIQNRITVNDNAIAANADAIQKTRDDFIAADSEIHQILNSHAGELTTLRNDVDDLGDEVAVIEGKIPASTTSSNQLVNNSQLLAEEQDIRDDMNQADSELQTQITAQAGAISTLQDDVGDLFADKLDKNQGAANANKILTVGTDGQITLSSAPGSGLLSVSHDATLTGAGTDASPLGIASTVLSEISDKADQAAVDLIAADYVSKTATAAQTIASSLQTPELTVGTAEGTLNLSIAAGVATIATNNGLDIISQTKFDTQPTTDDTTSWANATGATLVRKDQVASAVAAASAASMPTGTLIPFAGTTCPSGFIVANGGAVSRTTYADLFAVIGTTYGAGDGNSTFNLPNLDGRAPWYDSTATIGGISNGGLPNITGTAGTDFASGNNSLNTGAFKFVRRTSDWAGSVAGNYEVFYVDFNASRSSSIYGASSYVLPRNLKVLYCVKF